MCGENQVMRTLRILACYVLIELKAELCPRLVRTNKKVPLLRKGAGTGRGLQKTGDHTSKAKQSGEN